MNYEEAKKLKSGDRIKITYDALYGGKLKPIFGKFERLTKRGYIYYEPQHLAPPGQKTHIKYVESILINGEKE